MGQPCGTHGGVDKCGLRYCSFILKEKDQTVDRWRAVLNTTLNCTRSHFCVSFNEQSFRGIINIEGC